MIQIYLLTGFLGAGKTTMLQSLLHSFKDQKIGVIVNDFGNINIDARLIERDGISMAELSNGSIFCACIKDKFVDSLIEMSSAAIDFLFIEASGLADPASMAQILEGIRPYTKSEYLLAGSICIVDGKHFLGLADMLPALQNQVAYANIVILNKADLIDEEEQQEVRNAIEELNPGVKICVTSYCSIDVQEIVSQIPVSLKSGVSTNTVASRPNSFQLQAEEVLRYDGLTAFLEAIARDCYRIKGFVQTDRGPVEISAVGDDVVLNPWKEPVLKTEIVVISAVGIRMLSMILDASKVHLDQCIKLQ